jgi:aryl-alcohol dehydrogenase-like predicted oxidoreductase
MAATHMRRVCQAGLLASSRTHRQARGLVAPAQRRDGWPDAYHTYYDPFTPLEETLRTTDHLVQRGKVRYVGCSNFAAWQVADAMGTARALGIETLVSVEPEYGMLKRAIEKELLPCCTHYNVGILPYFPLASGFLTGRGRHRHRAMPAAARRRGRGVPLLHAQPRQADAGHLPHLGHPRTVAGQGISRAVAFP